MVFAAAITQRVDNLNLAALMIHSSVDDLALHRRFVSYEERYCQEEEHRAQDRCEDNQWCGNCREF